ncbi:trypsin-like peptidase domain-containing protein [Priestia filamentosa]|uniref:trypsin-like serine peptidase n=1 Tax=Priestia filamentosa TaxID=1402861 RepID=UPI003982A077
MENSDHGVSPCGPNDLQYVEQYDGSLGVTKDFVKAHMNRVAQIRWNNNLSDKYTNPGNVSGKASCSGTLISENLFLTAGHCFDSKDDNDEGKIIPRINGTNTPIPPAEIATNMHVTFNYQYDELGTLRRGKSFNILELIEYREGGLDFAIVKLEGTPSDIAGYAQIAKSDAKRGDMLCIIGHPEGLPKRIEAGPATISNGSIIAYDDIDTYGGSSGAGILLSPNGPIVGVHTTAACHTEKGFNYGIGISSLIRESPSLQRMVGLEISGPPSIMEKQNGEVEVAAPLSKGGIVYSWGRPDEFPKHFWDKTHIIDEKLGPFEDVKLVNGKYENIEYTQVIARNRDRLVHFWRGKDQHNTYKWSPPTIIATDVSGTPTIVSKQNGEVEVAAPLSKGGIVYSWGRPDEFPKHFWDKTHIIGEELGPFEDVKLVNGKYENIEYTQVIVRNGDHLVHFWRGKDQHNTYKWSPPRFFY